jgi:hypothetical protein
MSPDITDDIREWLAEVAAEHAQTKCPLDIAVPAAFDAIREVADLHEREAYYEPGTALDLTRCRTCKWSWPCPTIRRVAVALELRPDTD